MNKTPKWALVVFLILILGVIFGACGVGSDTSPRDEAAKKAEESGDNFVPFVPDPGKPNTEQLNYNEAQELYNDPTTILWCTVYPQANTSPIITVPVRGKLTSSSTTAFRPEEVINDEADASGNTVTKKSVDGLYHPNPPGYRYGFTPGNQYVDFFNLPTFCTTTPLKFQTDSVQVNIDSSLNQATKEASDALKSGDPSKAQDILKQAAGQ